MALQIISGPRSNNAGIFTLPQTFDEKQNAAKWVKEGASVDRARQREYLVGTNYTADGWEPFRQDGEIVKVSTASGKYVLMFRPRDIQDEVNRAYANVSRQRIGRETTGETIAGSAPDDGGMLTVKDLQSLQNLDVDLSDEEAVHVGGNDSNEDFESRHITKSKLKVRR